MNERPDLGGRWVALSDQIWVLGTAVTEPRVLKVRYSMIPAAHRTVTLVALDRGILPPCWAALVGIMDA